MTDAQGRRLCYPFVHRKCSEPCPKGLYHGPETEAMKTKRIADEKKMAERKAAGGRGTQSEIDEAPDPKAKAKAKGKGKGKPKAKAKDQP